MALPASESFANTNGVQLETHSANWTRHNASSLIGDFDIQTNSLAPDTVNTTGAAWWNADSFGANHYAEATIVAIASGIYIGLSVRNAAGTNSYVYSVDSADGGYFDEWVNGTYSALASGGSVVAVGNVIRMEAEGTTIRLKINGTQNMSVTDTSLATGAPGVGGYHDGTTSRIDDWIGDNMGTAVIDSQPAYLKGQAEITDTQPGYAQGQAATTDSQSGYLVGQAVATDAQPGYLVGQATITGSQQAYLNGSSGDTPASASLPGYLVGQAEITDSQPGYTQGQAEATGSQSGYLLGGIPSTGNFPAYMVGQATATDSQPGYLTGQVIILDSQPGYLVGQTVLTASQPAYTRGGLATTPKLLSVNPANGRYFIDSDGATILMAGSHFWNNHQDNSPGTFPPDVFDYTAWLQFLYDYSHNFQRYWVWEQARWSVFNTETDWWFYPEGPFARTGPGNALDGHLKFDLDTWDQDWFDRMRVRVIQAADYGVYCAVMMFEGWSPYFPKGGISAQNSWEGCPFHPSNNINSIDGDTDNDNSGEETHTLSISAVTAYQEAYVEKVIDTLNDLNNVLWEISNESDGNAATTAWQEHFIDYIHTYEAGKAKQHPVGFTVGWPSGDNADLDGSNAEWVSYNGNLANPPAKTDNAKVSIWDTDHLCGMCGDREFIWMGFTRGHNPIWMDGYDGSGQDGTTWSLTDPTHNNTRSNMGWCLDYANTKIRNLAAMTPQDSLASTGFCLAKTGTTDAEFLVYQDGTGAFTVNLSGSSGVTFTVEWLRPSNGAISDGGTQAGGSAAQSFTPPFSGDAVLFLQSTIVTGSQPAYLLAQGGATDIQPAYTKGQAAATASQAAFAYGQVEIVDSQPGYLVGQDEATGSQSAFAQGQATATGSQSGFAQGQAGATGSQPAFAQGQTEAIDAQPAFLQGQDTLTDFQDAFAQGQAVATGSQSAYTSGPGTTITLGLSGYAVGASPAAGSQSGYLLGGIILTAGQPAFAQGQAAETGFQNAFAQGQDEAVDTQPGYTKGQATTTDFQESFVQGQAGAVDVQQAYLKGQAEALATLAAYTRGQAEAIFASLPGYLVGQYGAVASQSAFLRGNAIILDSQPGYLLGGIILAATLSGYLAGQTSLGVLVGVVYGPNDTGVVRG